MHTQACRFKVQHHGQCAGSLSRCMASEEEEEEEQKKKKKKLLFVRRCCASVLHCLTCRGFCSCTESQVVSHHPHTGTLCHCAALVW